MSCQLQAKNVTGQLLAQLPAEYADGLQGKLQGW